MKTVLIFIAAAGLILSQVSCCFSSEQLTVKMQQSIESLNKDQPFTVVDLGLSDEERAQLERFQVESTEEYGRFGNLELLSSELPVFLRELGNNDEASIHTITTIITRTASSVAEASNKETAWVCVRAFTPDPQYEMPRWHCDGYYYAPYEGFVFKFAAALKGTQTLFYKVTEEMRTVFRLNEQDREFLSRFLELTQAETAAQGEGAFFIVGDQQTAAVHSEPSIREGRLFFSVLPGNKDEINELDQRWHTPMNF